MPPTLDDLFAGGTLVRPSDDEPNLVHLVRALATLAGVPDLNHAPATQDLVDLIGESEHYVFILLDGLGINLLRRLPDDSFLCENFRRQLNSTAVLAGKESMT